VSLGNVHSVVIPRRKKREDRFLNGGRVKHRALVGRTKAHVPLPSRIDISVSVPHMPLPSIVCQPAVRFENEDALHDHVDPPDSAHFHLQLAVQTELPHQQPQDRFLAGLRSTVQLGEHWDVHFRQLTEQRTELAEGKESPVENAVERGDSVPGLLASDRFGDRIPDSDPVFQNLAVIEQGPPVQHRVGSSALGQCDQAGVW